MRTVSMPTTVDKTCAFYGWLEANDYYDVATAVRLSMNATTVIAQLRKWRKQQAVDRLAAGSLWPNEQNLVFTTPKGTPVDPDNFRHRLTKIAEGAGLGKWTVYELRHSAGTLLFAMGVDVKFITEILGHSSDRVTRDIYIYATDEGKAEALNAMSAPYGVRSPLSSASVHGRVSL